jgi:hypothetical protein
LKKTHGVFGQNLKRFLKDARGFWVKPEAFWAARQGGEPPGLSRQEKRQAILEKRQAIVVKRQAIIVKRQGFWLICQEIAVKRQMF